MLTFARATMLHYLRIAVTALSLTACVLLIALSVRSYYGSESFRYWWTGLGVVALDSTDGRIYLSGSRSGGASLQPYLPIHQRNETDAMLWNNVRASENALGFGYFQDLKLINTSTLILPHWFVVFTFAMLAVTPWVHWSNRFSLRTLLIAITLVAVVLGIAFAAQ